MYSLKILRGNSHSLFLILGGVYLSRAKGRELQSLAMKYKPEVPDRPLVKLQ